MKNVSLIFGSFNPIHIGHLHLGDVIIENLSIDEVWYVVSPHNPHKDKSDLLDKELRLEMVEHSIKDKPNFVSCDIEFGMEKPSYTFKTLIELENTYEDHNFSLVMGSDVINNITSWKNYKDIIKYPIISFIRDEVEISINEDIDVTILRSNIELSSTLIRNNIKNGESLDGLLHSRVINYISKNNLYV
jgi:nicotinate-nucleotide adenylyltransferase